MKLSQLPAVVLIYMLVFTGCSTIAKTGQTTSFAVGDDGQYQAGAPFPNPRFTDNSDGTVTDHLTGLIWLKDFTCLSVGAWANALKAVNALANGHVACGLTDGSSAGDWRLPNHNELRSLLDSGRFDPAMPAGHPFVLFIPMSNVWSSTTYAENTEFAWHVNFQSGWNSISEKSDDLLPATAVRGGL